MNTIKSTTILCVKKSNKIVIASDGQATLGDMVCKGNVNKIRLLSEGKVIAGFAGSVSDSLILVTKLEAKISEYSGDLVRSVIELAKDWRSDKHLRNLESSMIVANASNIMYIGGNGEVMEVEDNIASVGSGSKFALAAAKALIDSDISAEKIVRKAMSIASSLCVYTNSHLNIQTIEPNTK